MLVSMPVLDELGSFLNNPLITLSGSPITFASVVTGIVVFLLALVLARLGSKAVRHALAARGLSEGAQHAARKIVSYTIGISAEVMWHDKLDDNTDRIGLCFALGSRPERERRLLDAYRASYLNFLWQLCHDSPVMMSA